MPRTAFPTLTADPLDMLRILWTAIDRIRQAREHLEAGDTDARAQAISAASQALIEMSGSLDHEAGGELSRRLAQLCDYMQWRLIDASLHQTAGPLNEVLGLLTTLSEALQHTQLDPPTPVTPASGAHWADETSTGELEYAIQAWSA